MHDIDRTQRELETEAYELEAEQEHEHEAESVLSEIFSEAEQEHEHEAVHEQEHEYEHEQFLGALFGEAEQEQEQELEAESPLSETQEMELASELLEVSNEAELEQFIGSLFKKAVGAARNFVRSPQGRALGGVLKNFAKKALPIAGSAVGGFFGGPLGSKIGGGLGRAATNLFELELEGLSHEDREMEVARQFVRLGAAAANRAARSPQRTRPRATAQRAFTSAARVYAPGLLRRGAQCRQCGTATARGRTNGHQHRPRRSRTTYVAPSVQRPARVRNGTDVTYSEPVYSEPTYAARTRSGRWFRRGRNVVLLGL